jgi:hypothetical protein
VRALRDVVAPRDGRRAVTAEPGSPEKPLVCRGMKRRLVVAVAASGLLITFALPARGAARPYLGNASCLSCHGGSLPLLPTRSCLSCHRGNMDFLEPAAGATAMDDPTLTMTAMALGGMLCLAAALVVASRRRKRVLPFALFLAAASGVAAFRSGPEADGGASRVADARPNVDSTGGEDRVAGVVPGEKSPPAWPNENGGASGSAPGDRAVPDGILVARNTAADLIPILSPSGDAVLFTRRDEDTNGDKIVDIRDGQALFLLSRDHGDAHRLTPYALDFAGAMARFSLDGSHFVVPLPTQDTDGDGRVTFADRHGLVVFHRDGSEAARLPSGELDLTDPQFSPEGQWVVAVEGRGLVEWDWKGGTRRTILEEAADGTFPRLAGWDVPRRAPLFTRGTSYRLLPRDETRVYVKPTDVALETTSDLVAPHGSGHRRVRVEMAHGDLCFYLDERPDGSRRLCRRDRGTEECLDAGPPHVLGVVPIEGGGAAFVAAHRRGEEGELYIWDPPGVQRSTGFRLRPGLMGLAGGRTVVLSGEATDGMRVLVSVDPASGAVRSLGTGPDLWYNPFTAGRAVGGVRVSRDTDGDGKRTPVDLGELWIVWEAL